ncbi:hypothetical protein F6P95_05235 [Escherichia coli]|nr:hypothetical protein F6P95_05235 [Escherichia coli]
MWRKSSSATRILNKRPITNVVMMGMGEPLLNLNNVVPAMEIMLDDFGFVFISCVLSRFGAVLTRWINWANYRIDGNFSAFRRAPNDEIRDEIVPINKKYNIETFLAAVHTYCSRRVSSGANQGRVILNTVGSGPLYVNDGTGTRTPATF